MAFNHLDVSSIEKHTGTLVNPNPPQVAGRAVYVDGIPCTREAAHLATLVRRSFKHVKFGVHPHAYRTWSPDGVHVYGSLCMYMPGDTFASCEFGYKDVSPRDTRMRYFVESRKIEHAKGRGMARHRTSSEKPEVIVKTIKRVAVPYDTVEAAKISADVFQAVATSRIYTAASHVTRCKRAVLEHSALQSELFSLVRNGHAFNNPTLRDVIAAWMTAEEKQRGIGSGAVHADYVNVKCIDDVQEFHVVPVFDVQRFSSGGSKFGPEQVLRPDELPESLVHKLAALSMLDGSHYVEGVGQKLDDSTYWVVRE